MKEKAVFPTCPVIDDQPLLAALWLLFHGVYWLLYKNDAYFLLRRQISRQTHKTKGTSVLRWRLGEEGGGQEDAAASSLIKKPLMFSG